VAVEQPLGLTLEIMRLRSFARTWQELRRPRREDEEEPRGAMVEWCNRIQNLRDASVIADALAHAPN
jgi:hypothetical protein